MLPCYGFTYQLWFYFFGDSIKILEDATFKSQKSVKLWSCLTHHELYQQIDIDPPRGCCSMVRLALGKPCMPMLLLITLLHPSSQLLAQNLFRSIWERVRKWFVMFFDLQKDNSLAIIFIDEVDSIATARFDAETGAARELRRILIELLNEMDGFEHAFDVKIDVRRGSLVFEVNLEDHVLFDVCWFRTAEMNLSDEVDLEDYVSQPDKVSAAEIAAICQETGMLAIRKNRYVILPKDFEKVYRSNMKKPDIDFEFYK
ncbi:UNVERIFIED_CONTAM: 26S proteasome regulatory subunitB [Sesamum angustifolium]|uniref:26S proteasome regulatory subunitB n=2 Tax=Sesamum angustifolium TaxID=2727405 RepID=A0AAW2IJJ6_9LAMI